MLWWLWVTMLFVTIQFILDGDDLFIMALETQEHQIHALPNFQGDHVLPFNHFAGQISLSSGQDMFYWYAESSDQPESDPVVLWLQGGVSNPLSVSAQ